VAGSLLFWVLLAAATGSSILQNRRHAALSKQANGVGNACLLRRGHSLHLGHGKAFVQQKEDVGVKPLPVARGCAVGVEKFFAVRGCQPDGEGLGHGTIISSDGPTQDGDEEPFLFSTAFCGKR
jgi:hypothetical protein